MAWLYQAYEAYLEENRLIDQPGLIEMAFKKIEKEKQPKDKEGPCPLRFLIHEFRKEVDHDCGRR